MEVVGRGRDRELSVKMYLNEERLSCPSANSHRQEWYFRQTKMEFKTEKIRCLRFEAVEGEHRSTDTVWYMWRVEYVLHQWAPAVLNWMECRGQKVREKQCWLSKVTQCFPHIDYNAVLQYLVVSLLLLNSSLNWHITWNCTNYNQTTRIHLTHIEDLNHPPLQYSRFSQDKIYEGRKWHHDKRQKIMMIVIREL